MTSEFQPRSTSETRKLLHKFCHSGTLKKVRTLLDSVEASQLPQLLSYTNVITGYTPLHEAVDAGHENIADYLLSKGAQVNSKTANGYTSLHLAASRGHVGCTRVLLNYGADITITDEYNVQPKKTAELCGRGRVVRLLRSEEIIKEVEANGDRLTELLRCGADALEPNVLNRALIAATKNDNPFNAGKLIIKGAANIQECLEIAKQENKPNARAMLLLVKAAVNGDKAIVKKLFGEAVEYLENPEYFCDDGFIEVQQAALSGKVSTVVPIEVARRHGQVVLREELLIHTDVNEEEGYVYWHGLRLLHLEVSWLRRIQWVKKLRLARNGFKSLPPEMGTCLKLVVKLDLQHNDLTAIPSCLLELPSLNELNLSHNRLTELPQVPEWSVCLAVLELSHNQLKNLPPNTIARSLRSLNLSYNELRTVPACVCSFTTLQSLDLSHNVDILALPDEMGRLKSLTVLNLEGLKDLREPPKNLHSDVRDCIHYLSRKLYHLKKFFHMKLTLLGCTGTGKTTLATMLLDHGYEDGEAKVGVDTSGWRVDVNTWHFSPSLAKKKFYFNVWDFSGEASYYALQRCFHSQHSLYLLLFNLTHSDDQCIQELSPWLDNLASQAPNSLVIIVGTHLDQVKEEERANVDTLLQRIGDLAQSYNNKLSIVEVMPVGLKNSVENIRLLKDAIYNHSANYKTRQGESIMGREVPSSYHTLYKQLEQFHCDVKYGSKEPIMHSDDFKAMVQQMSLKDIHSDDELKMATLFLTESGSLLHFNDCGHNLHEVYFIDPCSLYNMMSKVLTTPLSKNGLLSSNDFVELYKDNQIISRYLEQFIALLDQFEVALPLDNCRLIVPPLLKEERPDTLASKIDDDVLQSAYYRFISFGSRSTPPGFWGRLLSRVMHSVQCVQFALDMLFPSNQQQENGQLFPNFPSLSATKSFDKKDVLLEYWSTGLHYQDPSVMFRIESLSKHEKFHKEVREGVLIMTTSGDAGKQLFGQLVDLTLTLINQWYPSLRNTFEQKVPCRECMKQGRTVPYEFTVEQCLALVTKGATKVECGFFENDSETNHSVTLSEIVPDLCLQDIDSKFLLDPADVLYQDDKAYVLGKGAFAKVYSGKHHGKSVAIKKYIGLDIETFSWLRSEGKLLQQLHHPCIVCLVGMTVHPQMTVMLEEAPLCSLEVSLLKNKEPIHRLTVYRIASQVASALAYLHKRGIIFRDLNASNILAWTLDPDSLCHCKLADFVSATQLTPVGVKGVEGTKGFIAPEVLHRATNKRHSYDHKADIFSFGMFLYQLIARRYPYHYLPANRIDVAMETKERPRLQDVDVAHTGYHYLTQLMKKCWKEDPKQRPDASDIVKMLSLSPIQSIMCVAPIKSNFTMHKAISITSSDLQQAGNLSGSDSNELWVVCDGAEGIEINVYNTDTMAKVHKMFIKDSQTRCVSLCGDYVWMGSRMGIEYGVLEIFNIRTKDLAHNIRIRDNFISCITSSEKSVFVGTLEGYCFSFVNDIAKIRSNSKPRYSQVSADHAIDGIVATELCVWVSHTNHISLLNFDGLSLEGSLQRESEFQEAFIGQLSLSPDGGIIWSAQLGGTILTAWDACKQQHLLDIDTFETLKDICTTTSTADMVITAMTPALDCVWVGMSTGHIVVYHQNGEMMSWYHPYSLNIRFLTCINTHGPCKTEKSVVVSGAKGFKSLQIEGGNEVLEAVSDSEEEAGVVIQWEAYEAKTMQQMKLIEESAPGYLDDHDTVRKMIRDGGFKDGTHMIGETHTPGGDTEDISVSNGVPEDTSECPDDSGVVDI